MVNTANGRTMVVAYGESGKRIGQGHHNARISDETVDAIRERHENDGVPLRQLVLEFGLSIGTIRKLCYYQRRAQTPVRFKRIKCAASH